AFLIPIPAPSSGGSSEGNLRVAAWYPDSNGDGVVSADEAVEYVQRCRNTSEISGVPQKAIDDIASSNDAKRLRAAAIAEAMWRVFLRPEDFTDVPSPIGLDGPTPG